MAASLLDGKALSSKLRTRIAADVELLNQKGLCPSLAVVAVGSDSASEVYRSNLKKACDLCKIQNSHFILPENATESELVSLIEKLNSDRSVHGILLQVPLPSHIRESRLISVISTDKDVDAVNPANMGKIMMGKYDFMPCTPLGVSAILDEYNIDVCGKHCVVVGRSNVVGKPMSMLLLKRSATVTICHSKTQNLREITRQADILVVAVGRPEFITGDMIKKDSVVIDVGINRRSDGKLCGDVLFHEACEQAKLITPVPGGVGALTVTMLMSNVVKACKTLNSIDD